MHCCGKGDIKDLAGSPILKVGTSIFLWGEGSLTLRNYVCPLNNGRKSEARYINSALYFEKNGDEAKSLIRDKSRIRL